MAKSNRILAVDIGAASIKVAEFEYKDQGHPLLCGYDQREYDDELTDENRGFLIAGVLRQILVENAFQAKRALIAISGQAALSRFVKLPPVADEEHRVRQIVEFEAQQNVPFSMDEVLWDYQLIGTDDDDELEVMFVVIKNEIVEQITQAVRGLGLELRIVDIAPVCCYNAVRANHVGDDECAMVLNIGSRSTNLLFADRNRLFSRTIPIAGHTITQQVAKEFGIEFEEAEELKRRHGFVALGGAYEDPESEVATAVSKIVRTVMARLHGEINRSINVYRAQHRGKRPETLYLTGGGSIMAYTDQFFAEKLRMNVEYLNPFQVVTLAPNIDSADLQEKAHMFSEVVGLALRYRVQCPVEVNLIPASIRREQDFNRRKPYLVAAALCVLTIPLVSWIVNRAKADQYIMTYEDLQTHVSTLDRKSKEIRSEREKTREIGQRYNDIETLLAKRELWPELLEEIERLRPNEVWFDRLEPVSKEIDLEAEEARPPERGFEPNNPRHWLDNSSEVPRRAIREERGNADENPVYTAVLLHGNAVQIAGLDTHQAPDVPAEPAEDGTNMNDAAATDAGATPLVPATTELGDGKGCQSVELAFLRALQASPHFSDDPERTKIVTYNPPETILNYSQFVIRAELEEPLNLKISE